ncbi:MAG: NAD-dependent epimerase/dehydratase family protein [Flaviaesturariibacter sp.]|nr:NAD-dependent epimerase/dehydratase family protein [Flaviaesturariibacter sp.]
MPSFSTATLIGATGLIGSHLLTLLKNDTDFSEIRLLVRQPFGNTNARTTVMLTDFNDPQSLKRGIEGSEIVFCAIGTTQKKVGGDKQAYRKIDYDIAVNSAILCKESGCRTFVLVSSVGANAASNNFYLQLKGEIEEALAATGIHSLSIFRPSMLLGDRQEKRIGERIGQMAMKAFSFAIPAKYKPIEAKEVAAAMVAAAKQGKAGYHVYEYNDIKSTTRTTT